MNYFKANTGPTTIYTISTVLHVPGSGRKPGYPEETHTNTRRTCRLHKKPIKGPRVHLNPPTTSVLPSNQR